MNLSVYKSAPSSSIRFSIGDDVIMEFRDGRRIFVRGEEVEDNTEVVRRFEEWLERAETQPSVMTIQDYHGGTK